MENVFKANVFNSTTGGGEEMKRLKVILIAILLFLWPVSGWFGLTYHWLYCSGSTLDFTLDEVPIVLIVGTIVGPIAWVMVGWDKYIPDEVILIKNPNNRR